MYGLCMACLVGGKTELCTHSDEARQITDTWTIAEVVRALQLGYELVEVFELLVYDKAEFLFREFYLPLAAVKLQSEGFPRDDMSDEEKNAYCESLNGQMPGLDLQPSQMIRNDGKRAFAKLVSNAALGKLSQNAVRPSSKVFPNSIWHYFLSFVCKQMQV